jgi:hypothetical protein
LLDTPASTDAGVSMRESRIIKSFNALKLRLSPAQRVPARINVRAARSPSLEPQSESCESC